MEKEIYHPDYKKLDANEERKKNMSYTAMTPEEMDKAADLADDELREMKWEDVKPIAVWWKNHFMKAGHKRLGRALIQLAKEKGVK